MPTAGRFLAALRDQIGTHETPAGSNCNPYSHELGRPCEPWCQDFLVAIARRIGLPLPSSSASTVAMLQAFRNSRRSGTTPAAGAFAFFHIPGESSGVDHVGCVESSTSLDVTTIDGNTSVSGSQSNGGTVARRTRLRSWVVGYGYPAYTVDNNPKVAPMYNPPVIVGPIVADIYVPGVGYYQLDQNGWIHPWLGAPDHGQPPQDPRVPPGTRFARLEADTAGYTCIAENGARYGYPH